MSKQGEGSVVVIKPIWWRHSCFTLFLFMVAVFFAFVGYFGALFSWTATIFMAVVTILSTLDQLFEWSRLRIDRKGYHLRGWFRNKFFAHHEIVDFKIIEFTGKKLLAVNLSQEARKQRGLPDQVIPFPCSFGRPVDDVLATVRSAMDRTPRPRSSS